MLDEIIQHAIKAEDIANYQAQKFGASKWTVQKYPSMQDFKPSGSSEKFINLIENDSDVRDTPNDPKG